MQVESGERFAVERGARLAAGVREGDLVTVSQLAELQAAAARYFAERRGLSLLARAPHTQRGLGLKLRQRGYVPEVVEQCVTRLLEIGYLDDMEFARQWLRSRTDARFQRAYSRGALLAGLQQRGVSREDAAEAVGAELDDDYEERAAIQAAQRTKRGASPRAIATALYRRGFSHAAINRALAHLESDEDGDAADET